MKFKNIYNESREDVELSLLSLWAPGHHRMHGAIENLFKREPLMAEPVFQSMFPWELTDDANWNAYLDQQVINELQIGTAVGGFEPRKLQTNSWKQLHNGNSIVVTSGTGSGKTECFMYPVLSDLYSRKAANGNDPVSALFLYPLNALMQDQKERLGECCEKLGLKFAVYNRSLDEHTAKEPSKYPAAEVITRDRVRSYDPTNASCPQILLTNPSMLEYMLVRDKDKPIFSRSQGALRWIVIDEAHTYTGSAAIELAYLIKRVLQAFGVSRDDVQFICTSATIGDPSQPQELLDFINTIIGESSPASGRTLVNVDGQRHIAPLTQTSIDNALIGAGITETTGARILKLRDEINRKSMPLSSIWYILTGKSLHPSDTEHALDLIDRLCETKIGEDFLLMARGHFFMRNIEGLYACANHGCAHHDDYSDLGFNYLTTLRGDGKCPHCGAPLLEVVQCGDCKEFLLACEENDQHEIRPSFNGNWSYAGDIENNADEEREAEDDGTTDGGVAVDDNWKRIYLAFYGASRPYSKPNPNYLDSRISLCMNGRILESRSDAQGPWVMLQDANARLFCPTCAKGSGEDGHNFRRFHSSSNWLNGILAPSLLTESAPNGIEWGKYIAFTDSRQGTAIYAKRFNADAERSYARAKLSKELSDPQNNTATRTIVQTLLASGYSQAQINSILSTTPVPGGGLPVYSLQETADCIFNANMFEHIDYEVNPRRNATKLQKSEESYKAAMLRGVIGRKTIYLPNMENLGLITIVYPDIENLQQNNLPNICTTLGIGLQDWKDFLKIYLDYEVRMGNHIQETGPEERTYVRDTNQPTPFHEHPCVKTDNGGNALLHQHRLVTLLCAGLGIHDTASLAARRHNVDALLNEAYAFLVNHILNRVDISDPYHDRKDENENPGKYDGWYYLDMSPTSYKCRVKLVKEVWICPETNYLLDTIFMGYSPSIKGALCAENISRFAIPVNATKISVPYIGSPTYTTDLAIFKNEGLWNDRIKYALRGTTTGYLTAEHSGQQDRDILSHYTEEFKAQPVHRLNLLQCSTTMEMGVDIGNIDLVLLTNIPPSSANYMQRAGRAGRRGQSKAVAFSMCPNTAIGSHAFQNPIASLNSTNPAIKPVESDIIVQRHANSFFIRQFLLDPASAGVQFNTINGWLTPGGHGDVFIAWLGSKRTDANLAAEFAQVFGPARSILAYATATESTLTEIMNEYRSTWNDINSAIAAATSTAIRDALSIQLFNLEKQDPKAYLAEKRFLPNADMPTGVVEFNHMDASTFETVKKIKAEIENYRIKLAAPNITAGQKHNLEYNISEKEAKIKDMLAKCISTREIRIALSEYAPGQTVVINETNYVSAGIEWKNSIGQANPYKYIYRCSTCKRYLYTDNSNLTNCPNCGGSLRNILFPNNPTVCTRAIEPIRFRTDLNRTINHREHTQKTFFDIKTILTNVDWGNAQSGPLCDIVGNNDANGDIVFINDGNGLGYSLCLDCGKMEVFRTKRDGTNWPHDKITEKGIPCPVNNPENYVVLTGRFPTSFVAMKFYEDSSHNTLVNDEELLYSLGVLLCMALTKTIGISRDDIDFDIRQEQGFASIYIYDTSKGGCGYSTRMLDPMTCNIVFVEAKNMLAGFGCSCERHITGACVNCLIDRNSQRKERSLSKFKLMAWFAGQSMAIGSSTSGAPSVAMPLQLLATREAHNNNTQSLTFCVNADEMCLPEWSHRDGTIGRIIDFAVSHGKSVNILVSNVPSLARGSQLDDLIPFINLPLQFQNWNVNVQAVDTLEVNPGEISALIVNGTKHFFTDQNDVLPFNEKWGKSCSQLYESCNVPTFVPVQFPTIQDVTNNSQPDEFTRDLTFNDSIQITVGGIFNAIVQRRLLHQGDDQILRNILHGQNVEISFSDAYVNSALASLILVYLIKGFSNTYGFNISNVNLQFRGRKRNCRNLQWSDNSLISYNFPDEQDADDYTRTLFEDILGITPIFSQIAPDHCRWIRFKPSAGDKYIEFRPDHGIDGGWNSNSRYIDLDLLDDSTPVFSRNENSVYYLLVKKK